jgi:hypothetical protein
MKRSFMFVLRLAAFAAAVVALQACAQKPAEPVIKDALYEVEASVEAIDPATRMVLLAGPRGPLTIIAGPDVRNFDRMRVGDKVRVSYYQGVAAQIVKRGSKLDPPMSTESSYRAPRGSRPAGAVGHAVTATVQIESVDTSFDTVTFRRGDGFVRTLAVQSPEARGFIRTLRRGDQVEIAYTEAIAVEVVPGR